MSSPRPYSDDIVPFLAMEVMERGMAMAREGRSIVQMGVGEPDFDAPPCAVEAAIAALRAGRTHYTDSRGMHALRVAIAEDSGRRRGATVSPDQVLVTMGTSPALAMVLAHLVAPGDEVVIPTPHYPCYPNMVAAVGGRPVFVPTRAEGGFVVDPDDVRQVLGPRTRAVLLGSPSNPTGAVQPPEVVRAVAALGVPVLSDEIYDGLLYDGAQVTSPLGLAENIYVFDGVSKRYAMTGFRIGWVIAPAAAMRTLVSLQQNLAISASEPMQYGALAALREGGPDAARMRGEYTRRRALLVDGVRALGFDLPVPPLGAFYVLAGAKHLGDDSLALAMRLLDETGVALGPGRDFGDAAEGTLRFSFATSSETLAEGLGRLRKSPAAPRTRP